MGKEEEKEKKEKKEKKDKKEDKELYLICSDKKSLILSMVVCFNCSKLP